MKLTGVCIETTKSGLTNTLRKAGVLADDEHIAEMEYNQMSGKLRMKLEYNAPEGVRRSFIEDKEVE